MKYLLTIVVFALFVSCGFSPSKEDQNSGSKKTEALNHEVEKLDSDGDFVTDKEEIERGRNAFVADVPKVKVNFLQNYNIQISYNDNSLFEIDTLTAKDDPEFKYRIGALFLKENSLNNAAKLGRFSGVTWGHIKQEDYSWVKYPDIDEKYYFSKKAEFEEFKEKEIVESKITLENSLKLMESPYFKSIEDLELNFYYYSYEKEAYIPLHTQKIDQVFQGGVRENFEVVISNPPQELITDSYMRHGKFIISEIKDFYIPDYKITYREFLASVKAKTVPVYKTTPYENGLNYVAVPDKGDSFINILSKLYFEKFEINDEMLVRLEQFSNKLPSFKYLYELKNEDKSGQWFVMTNALKQHYLKHKFTNQDSITLSYIMGSELANREDEIIPSFRRNVFSGSTEKMLPLGNISRNSKVSLSIYLESIKGVKLLATNEHFSFSPRCRGNCSGANWSVRASFSNNRFKDFDSEWNITNYEEALPAFNFYINNTKISTADLIKDNILSVTLKNDSYGNYLFFEFSNLHRIDVILSGQENTAFLEILPLSVGYAGEGLEVKDIGGRNIDKNFHAGLICLQEADKRKIPLAVTSWGFNKWQNKVSWGVKNPKTGFVPKKGQKRKYYNGVVVDVVSKVTNFYN